jgi:diadenosine tetraphosphate (Ap4A) HIT family hydrolase
MGDAFTLHPQLAADTVPLVELDLSSVLLMDEPAWPWLVLVPQRPALREIVDLDEAARHTLMDEIAWASTALQRLFNPDKLNVGALGNMVPQLHVHVIARRIGDHAWPGPVWGSKARDRHAPAALAERAMLLRRELA